MGIFLVSYMCDLIGTPVYVISYNRNLTVQIRTMKPVVVSYEHHNAQLTFNVIDLELRF